MTKIERGDCGKVVWSHASYIPGIYNEGGLTSSAS